MELDANPDDAVPEAPAPRQKAIVRDRYKSHGWATPPANLVAVYLEACERHRVPANSAVIDQLQRRARLMQSGPWQRVSPPDPLAANPTTVTFAASHGPPGGHPLSAAASAPALFGAGPAPQPSASLAPSPSYALTYSPSQPSYAASQGLSPISSHMVVAATSHSAQELRDLIMGHVHPVTLGPSLLQPLPPPQQPGATALATTAASVGRGSGGGAAAASGKLAGGVSWGGASYSQSGLAGAPGVPPPVSAQASSGVYPPHARVSQNHSETISAAAMALAAGPEGAMYSARAVERVCRLVDPRTPWEQQLSSAGLTGDRRVISEADFQRLLEVAASSALLGELRQAALEVLSRPVGYGTLDVEGLAGALFDYLDVTGQGFIPAAELRSAVCAFCPAAASDMYGMIERHPPMGRMGSESVTRDEFVAILTSLAPSLAPAGSPPTLIRDKTEISVNAMLDTKIRDPFGYDFSRCYLGPRGLLPVLDALSSDGTFAHLSLANCGLGCGAVEKLAEWLQGHPCLTSLDLTNNVIADRGGMALTRLLAANPGIVELGIGSTYLLPPRASRTHHDALGPSPCEDARPLLEALAANRAARRSAPAEIVRALRQHGPELRAMCYSLLAREAGGGGGDGGSQRPGSAPSDGRVPLAALREALGEVTAEWGFTADALDEVLHHERLLGTATAGRTADDSGKLGVTYDELMQFLRSEEQVVRVAQAFRNHLVETKQLFFSLAPEPATAACMSPAGVSGPRTALSTVRQAIVAAAVQPGSGWDVSEEDLEAVLSSAFMRQHIWAAPTGNGRSMTGMTAAPPPAVGPNGLVVTEWATAAAAAAAAPAASASGLSGGQSYISRAASPTVSSASGQGAGGTAAQDMLISWPELCNTLLYLFNR